MRVAAGLTVLLLALAPGAGPAEAQVVPDRAPDMPAAPDQFRLGATASRFSWPGAGEERNGIDGLTAGGVELEALLHRFLGLRLGLSLGGTEIRAPSGAAEEVRQVLVELLAAPRLAVEPLRRVGVTPWAEVGVGTLVHQPTDSLRAVNQNALVFGAGVDWDVAGAFGVRAGWRTLEIRQSDVFASQDRSARKVRGHRAVVALYWRF